MGMTVAEKVLARGSKADSLAADEYVTATVDRMLAHEAFGACARALLQLGITQLFDPDRVVVILDHCFPAPTSAAAFVRFQGAGPPSTPAFSGGPPFGP
jgi:3-isopropylmalate/(R)-2-methylmalate dehydratase large subunit